MKNAPGRRGHSKVVDNSNKVVETCPDLAERAESGQGVVKQPPCPSLSSGPPVARSKLLAALVILAMVTSIVAAPHGNGGECDGTTDMPVDDECECEFDSEPDFLATLHSEEADLLNDDDSEDDMDLDSLRATEGTWCDLLNMTH